uniref:Poly(A) polymerase catalytic subunit domain-containing protein n=1 Tax=viral metagenome TaxID=1070528 RepID=A0A6C0JPZ4_9ZZZZ
MEVQSAIINNLKYQKKNKKEMFTKPKIFNLIENYISKKELICYGGTAINAHLPTNKKIYEYIDIPDYDCYSSDAINDAKTLSNILAKYSENVEVKSAMFKGTYKIFINFISIVDFTQMNNDIFTNLHKKSIKIDGLLYAPPNYLKISLYQELSRPLGDISRWDKLSERLSLLNESHPLYIQNAKIPEKTLPDTVEFLTINKFIINEIKLNNWVVFGDFGLHYYLKYFPKKYLSKSNKLKTPYILVENLKDVLNKLNFKYTIKQYSYKIINDMYQIIYNGHPVLYVFITDSCQSYNTFNGFNIASIDTILCIYYALSFIDIPFINKHTILSYCYLLHNINTKSGVCRRFHMPCVGTQETYEHIRKLRDKKYQIYKKTGSKKIFKEYFFQYKPQTKKIYGL